MVALAKHFRSPVKFLVAMGQANPEAAATASKVAWTVFMIFCGVIAVWQINDLISDFKSDPHYVTNIFVMKEPYNEFPNVTVCNMNRVNMTKAKELNMTPSAVEFLYVAQLGMYDITTASYDPTSMGATSANVVKKQRDAWAQFWPTTGLSNVADLYRILGHDCQNTFGMCKFGQAFDCCSRATPIINSEFGLCWTMSPPPSGQRGDMATQDFPGMTHGLRLYLNPGLEHYPSSVFYNNYLEEGMIVAPSFDPKAFWLLVRATLTPGTHSSIELENFVYRNTRPKIKIYDPKCTPDAQTKHMDAFASHPNCVADCMQKLALEKCNCYIMGEMKNKSVLSCSPTDMADCYFPAMIAEYEPMETTHGKSCCSTCMEPCPDEKTVKMRTTISIGFPAPKFLKPMRDYMQAMHGGNFSEQDIKQWTIVDLYYTTRGYTVIDSTMKVELCALIGNVGGQLGLWLRASILSVIQVGSFIIEWIKSCKNKKESVQPDDKENIYGK